MTARPQAIGIETVRKLPKFYDFAATMPLVVLCFIGIIGLVGHVISEWARLLNSFTVLLALNVAYDLATIMFFSLVLTLVAFRRMPQNYAKGVLPWAAAVIGTNIQLLFVALPRVENSLPVVAASTFVTIIGLVGSIYVAAYLGRSFSVLPQARGLVTTGPYSLVRHPLYIAEQVAALGVMWQYAQPWAFFIILAGVAAQLLRMHYEEKVLAETYPAYRAYMLRTGRIIPRLFATDSIFRRHGRAASSGTLRANNA
jgi:protein-S-isoprenylcysteine O-methyltransferase Ste14